MRKRGSMSPTALMMLPVELTPGMISLGDGLVSCKGGIVALEAQRAEHRTPRRRTMRIGPLCWSIVVPTLTGYMKSHKDAKIIIIIIISRVSRVYPTPLPCQLHVFQLYARRDLKIVPCQRFCALARTAIAVRERRLLTLTAYTRLASRQTYQSNPPEYSRMSGRKYLQDPQRDHGRSWVRASPLAYVH